MSVYCQGCRFSYAGPCPKHGGNVEQPEAAPEQPQDDQPVETNQMSVAVNEQPEEQPDKKPGLLKRLKKSLKK